MTGRLRPTFFPDARSFRAWLAEHHMDEDELWVGFHKKATGRPSMTWNESVDEALCFGWIDGLRRGIDAGRYEIRFSPRRASSNWSTKNVASARRLIEAGRMMPAGREAFDARSAERSGVYSFEQDGTAPLPEELRSRFERHPGAWEHFRAQPPGYQRTLRHWVVSAKREETRLRRLDRLIEVSRRGKQVDLLSPFKREI